MINHALAMILTQEEINRLTIENHKNQISIIADVHGMKCHEAKRFINNIINSVRTAFQLTIIHGYNHGTAIKDMLAKNFRNSHITGQYVDPFNKGMTHILVTA